MVGREHMLSKSRGSYVSVLQSPAVFTKTMVQGPTCLANVGAGAFSTWDAVHHTFPSFLARTLCCTTVLTVHPSGLVASLCCYYYLSSHFSLYFLLFSFICLFPYNLRLVVTCYIVLDCVLLLFLFYHHHHAFLFVIFRLC